MMTQHKPSHLDDAELLDLLDGHGAPLVRERWLAHVHGCDHCAGALQRLRARAASVSAAIAELQPPAELALRPPPPRLDGPRSADTGRRHAGAGQGWLRAAAIVALLLVPVLAVEPVRAAALGWLADRWHDVTALVTGAQDPAGMEAAGSTLFFEPDAAVLSITIAEPQAVGTLTLRRSGSAEASFEIVDGGTDEAPVVVDGGLRIRNGSGSVASYDVAVPDGVERVRVRVGSGPESTFRVGDATWQRVLMVR